MAFLAIIKYELIILLREKQTRVLLLAFSLCALMGLMNGMQVIGSQEKAFQTFSETVYQRNISYVEQALKDPERLGRLFYYTKFPVKHIPAPHSVLSIGQRDLQSYLHELSLLGIFGQIFNGSYSNPFILSSGYVDLSFFFVLLFPLLVLLFTYDLGSKERDLGVHQIFWIQQISFATLILAKMTARFFLLSVFISLVISFSFLFAGISFAQAYTFWMTAMHGYLLFWLSVGFFINTWRRSTTFNVVAAVSVWLFFCLLLPTMANIVVEQQSPARKGYHVAIQHRAVLHHGWDIPRKETYDRFYQIDKKWQELPHNYDKFNWGYYYAMQDVADEHVRSLFEEHIEDLRQREAWALWLSAFIPSLRVQLSLNQGSGTHLGAHIHYLKEIDTYQKALKEKYYPRIFAEEVLTKSSQREFAKKIPPHSIQAAVVPFHVSCLWPLFVWILLLQFIGWLIQQHCYRAR